MLGSTMFSVLNLAATVYLHRHAAVEEQLERLEDRFTLSGRKDTLADKRKPYFATTQAA